VAQKKYCVTRNYFSAAAKLAKSGRAGAGKKMVVSGYFFCAKGSLLLSKTTVRDARISINAV